MSGPATAPTGEKKRGRPAAIKFPCGNCNKTTSGCSALKCNICEMWHHSECIPGMTKEAHQQVVSLSETMGYTFFLCGKCEKVHKKTWQSINVMSKKVDSMEQRLSDVEKQLKDFQKKQEETSSKVTQVENRANTESTTVKHSVLSEIQEQEKRTKNIVVYNLEEPASEDGPTRKTEDANKVKELIDVILPDCTEQDVSSIRRLGAKKQDEGDNVSKPRPLLLTFNSVQAKKNVLSNSRNLAKSTFKHVSICPDLTKTQQTEDKKLRNEIRILNEENLSDDKGDFLWKVVGVPGQASRRKVKIYKERIPNAV